MLDYRWSITLLRMVQGGNDTGDTGMTEDKFSGFKLQF